MTTTGGTTAGSDAAPEAATDGVPVSEDPGLITKFTQTLADVARTAAFDSRLGTVIPSFNTAQLYNTAETGTSPLATTARVSDRNLGANPPKDGAVEKDILEGKPPERVDLATARDNLARILGRNNPNGDRLATEILNNLQKNELLAKDPAKLAEQLQKITRSMEAVLNPTTDEAKARMDGQSRINLVNDLAQRLANPEQFVNQGRHPTCALNAMQKLVMQGADPARAAEMLATAVNNGVVQILNPLTQRPETIEIDSRSLRPDAESSQDPTRFGGRDVRGMAGHALDAIFGQIVASHGVHDGGNRNMVYIASGADRLQNGQFAGRATTGEGLFRRDPVTGQLTRFEGIGPGTTPENEAILSRALGLPPGVILLHSSMAYQIGSIPPEIRQQIRTFDNIRGDGPNSLERALKDLQTTYGRTSGFLRVEAPFLPGGGMNGHGLHAVNVALRPDGSFFLDNNWGTDRDITGITDQQLLLATDYNTQRRVVRGEIQVPGGPTPGDVPKNVPFERPDIRTPEAPGMGRTPLETPDVYQKRMEQLHKQQQEDLRQRLDQINKDPNLQKNPQERENIIRVQRELQDAYNDFEKAHSEWMRTDRRGLEPSLATYLGRVRR